ncbi:metabotropic glutamate receptor [Holotrichia oblita]|uniref:Metabotropic glutamate receptor n=1 Tax=Holotrichia oblita TaxID=644536 RepID=A0ACB9T4E8_HOLOL|nr:metabotropic glutamate receptor [Holotrichia oblita]
MRPASFLVVLIIVKIIYCQTTINYKVNTIYDTAGDLKINFLLEDCTENLPVESSLGRTYINSAIWIIERLNLLQITTPLTLGLSVYQVCNDSDVYNSLFHIFQQHYHSYQVGIVNVKPFSRNLIDFSKALDIKTSYVHKYRKPLIRASVELLTLLNWKEDITLLTQYNELVQDFYKYSRRQWICVQRLIKSEIHPITLTPSSPTVVFAEKEVINIVLSQLHTQQVDWKIIFVPLDGEPVNGLPEGSYLIQPTYGDVIQTFTETPKIIPSPLFFDIAHPLINYAKELAQVIIQHCNNTSYKLNCLRNKYQDIFSYQTNSYSSLINFLKIEPLSTKFNYNIYRIDNVSFIDLNKEKTKTFHSLSKIFSFNIFDETLLEIEETILDITNTTNTSADDCSKQLPHCVLTCLNFENSEKRTIIFSINIYPRSDSWIFAFISVSILGVIFCLAIIIFILVRLFQKYIFEGNPTLTILLLIVVVIMYLSIIPFALDSDDEVKTSIMMARSLCISLPYAAAFSLLLSRAILLATISKEVGFMSHVAGTVQSFLCLFIFGVQCAVSLQVVRRCEDAFHDFFIMYLLSYNIILLLMLLCLTPLIVKSQRNYKEGRYFTIATILTALSWSIWVPTYVLLEEEWKDPILCIGLVCTASILLGSLFIPRTYMMAVAAARDRFANALPSLATATSAMDIYRASTQGLPANSETDEEVQSLTSEAVTGEDTEETREGEDGKTGEKVDEINERYTTEDGALESITKSNNINNSDVDRYKAANVISNIVTPTLEITNKDNLELCVTCSESDGNCVLCQNKASIKNNRNEANQGQKRVAEAMLINTAKKLPSLEIGSCVLLPVDKIDRGPSDMQNLICVITDYRNGVYQVGCSAGRIKSWFNRPDLIHAKEQFLTVDNVPHNYFSKREAVQALSLVGGQGYFKCSCKPAKKQCLTDASVTKRRYYVIQDATKQQFAPINRYLHMYL